MHVEQGHKKDSDVIAVAHSSMTRDSSHRFCAPTIIDLDVDAG